ncbi:MAG: response regulator [Bdellovibrionales bacterium]|nr:response regulator [Bdellovibrionales bacterium]MBK9039577.1 response regulator [Bdellovibrionales bacterium]
MKILLAEDDPNISLIAKLALEQLGGHQVHVATDGKMALEMALSYDFDLILLDEMMPKMNGLSVCRKYRESQVNKAPVIFLSAKSQESDITEFRNEALGYIPKPFDPASLCQDIMSLLNQSGKVIP